MQHGAIHYAFGNEEDSISISIIVLSATLLRDHMLCTGNQFAPNSYHQVLDFRGAEELVANPFQVEIWK